MRNMIRISVVGVLAVGLGTGCPKKEAVPEVTSPEAVPPERTDTTTPATREVIAVNHDDFKGPECIIWDAERDIYYVTNQNGGPMDASDNGFVSKIAPDGNVIASKWIDGASDSVTLNSPKGMAIANGMLYVADIDTLRKFDLETGEPRGEVKLDGTTLLNDVATDGENFFLTDTAFSPKDFSPTKNDAVYRVDNRDAVAVLHKDEALKHPTGVDFFGSDVYVVGAMATSVHKVAADGTRTTLGELPSPMLDGLVILDENRALISSWNAGGVYLWEKGKEAQLLTKDMKTPATIGYDKKRGMLLVPLQEENRLEFHPLELGGE